MKLKQDFHANISKDTKKRFDTSDCPENHPSGIKAGINKKVIGKLKMKLVENRLHILLVSELNFTVIN